MKRKFIFSIILLLVTSNLLLAKAKNDPYVEDPTQEWGDLLTPSSIWSPYAASVHAGRLGTDTDVDAFTVSFADPKVEFPFQIYVPVCGQHFADFRPSVALIGSGLKAPPAGTLPFDLPKGMGAQVFADDRNLNGARIALPSNNITGEQPVYSTDKHTFSVPQKGSYTIAVWEPDGNIGAYMLSTGAGGDSFAPRPDAELEASFDQLFSMAWIGQDCNAALTLANCDAESGSASPAVKSETGNFLLTGIVRDTATCQPVSAAEISYSLIGSENSYPRGTVTTDAQGGYQIESALGDVYTQYSHIMVTIKASGYQMAVADYMLGTNTSDAATFDLALQPAP